MLEFRRFSKQSYWKGNQPATDDINIRSEDWEVSIEAVDLGKETAIQIHIFEDAVKCLKNPQVLKALTEMGRKTTLEQAEEVLRDNGIGEVME